MGPATQSLPQQTMSVEHVTLFESLRSLGEHVYVPREEYAWQPEMPLIPEEE